MTDKNKTIDVCGLSFNSQNNTIYHHGKQISVDPVTGQLVSYFLANPKRAISREELIENVWQQKLVSDNAINRAISTLRKILGGEIDRYIVTIPKVGYLFEPKLEPQPLKPQPLKPQQKKPSTELETTIRRNSVAILLFILTLILAYWLTQSQNGAINPLSSKVAPRSAAINIALLPFDDLSDNRQSLFISGLKQEILNSVLTIPQLHVVNLNSATATVDYSLHGSVRAIGNTIRVNVNLIEQANSQYIFSTQFDHSSVDILAIQTDISQQLAAALKITLVHRDPSYSSALSSINYVALERLLVAKKQIAESTTLALTNAITSLEQLNRQHPQTPEIIGLLSLTYSRLNALTEDKRDSNRNLELKLAQQTLALDRTNLDALKTLYYYYVDFPHLRTQAKTVSVAAVRYHPQEPSAYRSRLSSMIMSRQPCDKIRRFINTIPPTVFSAHRLKVINHIIDHCLDSKPLQHIYAQIPTTNAGKWHRAIDKNVRFFAVQDHLLFNSLKSIAKNTPNNNSRTAYYLAQLMVKNYRDAAIYKNSFGQSTDHYWRWQREVFAALHQSKAITFNHNHLAFAQRAVTQGYYPFFVAALIQASRQNDGEKLLNDHLASITPFSYALFNRDETLGLAIIQYFAGQPQQSQATAKQLFDLMKTYWLKHPASYYFWGLGSYQLKAKLYCGALCQWPGGDTPAQILDHWFKPEHSYWLDDIKVARLVLSPWNENPVVKEYLSRIERSRSATHDKLAIEN